jgi:hypothetical protein
MMRPAKSGVFPMNRTRIGGSNSGFVMQRKKHTDSVQFFCVVRDKNVRFRRRNKWQQ